MRDNQLYDKNGVETWLTWGDMQRLWTVVMENAAIENATGAELDEFIRVLTLVHDFKISNGVSVSKNLQ